MNFDCEVYNGADHGFFNHGRKVYDPEAAKLAWERAKGFIG
jgi:dienelactone hydrolase